MPSEYATCGKSSKNAYDPQVAANAAAQTALAQRAQQFSEDYTNKYITPMLEQQSKLAARADERESAMFDMNSAQMKRADERYTQYGIPAEDAYYKMAKEYSAPAKMEEEAGLALGDARVAAKNGRDDTVRRLQSMGIDPSSPAAMAALSDMSVANTLNEAGAQNRARSSAKALGMQLTSDAANFGRGGASSVLAFGQAASGNTNAGLNAVGGAIGSAVNGASVNQNGQRIASSGYSSNLDAYSGLAKADMQQQASSSAGIGSFIGQIGGMALGGPIGGMIAGKLAGSDRRLKTHIHKLYAHPDGYNVYEFAYKARPDVRYTGVMADEVGHIPGAVHVMDNGYMAVDYARLAVDMKEVA